MSIYYRSLDTDRHFGLVLTRKQAFSSESIDQTHIRSARFLSARVNIVFAEKLIISIPAISRSDEVSRHEEISVFQEMEGKTRLGQLEANSLLDTRNSFSNPEPWRGVQIAASLAPVYVMVETSSLVARQYNVECVNPVKPNTAFSGCRAFLPLRTALPTLSSRPASGLNSPSLKPLPLNSLPALLAYLYLFFHPPFILWISGNGKPEIW